MQAMIVAASIALCRMDSQQPKFAETRQRLGKRVGGHTEHPNGWHRDTAARLLYQRQDKTAVPLLMNLLEKSRSPLARMHALHALDGLGTLRESDVLTALNDQDATVREHGIKFSEKFNSAPSQKLFAGLLQMANDPSIAVRYQLAFTLGEFDQPARIAALAAIAAHDLDSPWIVPRFFPPCAKAPANYSRSLRNPAVYDSQTPAGLSPRTDRLDRRQEQIRRSRQGL